MSMTFALAFESLSARTEGEEDGLKPRFDLLFGLGASRRAVSALPASFKLC